MGLDNGLKLSFESHGQVTPCDQGDYLSLAATLGIESAKRSGVCWELCRRWVRKRLGQTLDADGRVFPVHRQDIEALIATHAAHNHAGLDANYQVSGAAITGQAKRKWVKFGGVFRLKAKGLKSRAAIIDHMYADPGLYIFGFYKDGGHAVAFHVTDEDLAFFDPNMGQFVMSKASDRAFFKQWFSQYWGRYYKDEYTKGERELTKYGDDPVKL